LLDRIGLVSAAATGRVENLHRVSRHGRRGDLLKLLWWDGDGLCLFAKRLERGRFIWPRAEQGVAVLTPAQLSMLLEGIDWRRPVRTAQPELAG
jgi:transposase